MAVQEMGGFVNLFEYKLHYRFTVLSEFTIKSIFVHFQKT